MSTEPAVRHTPLGASVSLSGTTKEHNSSRGTLIRFSHRSTITAAKMRRQQLAYRRPCTRQQQMELLNSLGRAVNMIPETKDKGLRQCPVNLKVIESIFSGYTPFFDHAHVVILGLATNQPYRKLWTWKDNNREFRTIKGKQRVTGLARPWFLEPGKAIRVYPEKVRAVEEMTLERLIQLVEAERDRQTILLGVEGFVPNHKASKEAAGTLAL
ncbi:uncharacterized protein SCHCODRAFT_02675647 [Schizophyllum commune H4-8]|uniref:Uncharacterized protein n=1 Tax=Schizophyllum commune (strain H4-8 / FGSC 9210) TaxID=578458 RepID=D8PPP9_SCHCM|nr:uncharacterized protein SCHCODRAFT_02675647 [Schizophyllum commune H4-8]KAI5898354.1 hypothetical protein SCHCODRAFT_02675647 [Schizophyllum commune H4-8]